MFPNNPQRQASMMGKRAISFPGVPGSANAQEKILAVTKGLGIDGMEILQATTRQIYDSLPVDGRLDFQFFKGCNNRAFPLTNLSQNKLEVGEAFIIETLTLNAVAMDAGTTNALDVQNIENITGSAAAYVCDFSLEIANSIVVKPISMVNLYGINNRASNWGTTDNRNEPYEFRTLLAIPSLQEFIASLKFALLAAVPDTYIRMTLEGIGVIYRSPRSL